jgi:predicted alpha/beta hydrolase family esterase
MTIHRARAVSAAWGAITVDVGASGHINTEAGFGPWPAGERLLDELVSGRGLYRRLSADRGTASESLETVR